MQWDSAERRIAFTQYLFEHCVRPTRETKPLALLGLLCRRALADPIARFPRHERQERIHPEIRATPNADPA